MTVDSLSGGPALEMQASSGFYDWLAAQNVSLVCSTYQSNRLFFIGRKSQPGRLAIHERLMDRPMGLYWQDGTLTVATKYQIWKLKNVLQLGETYEGADQLYVPRQAHTTGDVNAHEVVVNGDGQTLFVNTDFSCVAGLHSTHSFQPLWQPPFISKLAAEDRCHLNGLALRDGKPAYATACGATDDPAGWRNTRDNGGVVLNLTNSQIVATGLSMPHSPRWHQGKLWVLNAGSGELGHVENGQFVPLCFLSGFVRGLSFIGSYAVVGLSKLRSSSFGGLSLEKRLLAQQEQARCGLVVVDTRNGEVLEHLFFHTLVDELFDVVALSGVRQPRALGLQSDEVERLITYPDGPGIVVTKPGVKFSGVVQHPHVVGLPDAEPSVQYQQVHNLTPDNLKPYDFMTTPSLQARWVSSPQRGELVGVSASLGGQMVGLAIAEIFTATNGSVQAELLSVCVMATYLKDKEKEIRVELLRYLQHRVNNCIKNVHQN